MSIISDSDRKYVQELFNKNLQNEVRIVVFTQEFECAYCKETRGLIQELTSLDDRIKIDIYDFVKDDEEAKKFRVDKIPATILLGEKDYGIRYFGLPAGYEFGSLIEDIVDVSRRASRLSDQSKERIKMLKEPVHIQVFVTPTCPYCPRAVRLAHQLALENEWIRADMVESVEYPQLSNKYGVMSVPHTIINDSYSFVGALPEPQYVDQIFQALRHVKEHPYS